MRKVYIALDVTRAGIVRGMLEANGIEAIVRGEALFGARGLLPVSVETAPSVWVDDAQFERARALIEAAEQEREHLGPEWTCPACSEVVDAELNQCWRCSADRV